MKNLETTTDELKRNEEGWCNYISNNAANRDLWFCGSDGVQLFAIEYLRIEDDPEKYHLDIDFVNDLFARISANSIRELHEKFDIMFCDVEKRGYKKEEK